jgi:hypothetical protein
MGDRPWPSAIEELDEAAAEARREADVEPAVPGEHRGSAPVGWPVLAVDEEHRHRRAVA